MSSSSFNPLVQSTHRRVPQDEGIIRNISTIAHDGTLRIVQLNMDRSAAVNDQLLEIAKTRKLDVALLQEPYTRAG